MPLSSETWIEAIAIGLIHSYANGEHDSVWRKSWRRPARRSPSPQVCPEIREYERQSTACANAYVQPKMAGYLTRLNAALETRGMSVPVDDLRGWFDHAGNRCPLPDPSQPSAARHLATEIAKNALDDVVSIWAAPRLRFASLMASSRR